MRTVELERVPERLVGRERDSLAQASGFPARRLPANRSMMDRLDVSPDGWIWVRRQLQNAERHWDIFDGCGSYLGSVEAPRLLETSPLQVLQSGTLLGVMRDELDVEYVVRMRLVRDDGTAVTQGPCN